MIACVIRYEIDPLQREEFETYARSWTAPFQRCGANPVGYFTPHEGSLTKAYGIYTIASLAEYEAYKKRLADDPGAREALDFAKKRQFIRREDRIFMKIASGPFA
jgi:hypothetical protein